MPADDKTSTGGLFPAAGIIVAGLVLTIYGWDMGIQPLVGLLTGQFRGIPGAAVIPFLLALLSLIFGIVVLAKGLQKVIRVLKSS